MQVKGPLNGEAVRALIPMPSAIEAVRLGFTDLTSGRFEMPVRTVLGDGEFLVMSVHHRPTRTMVVKTVSVNFERTPSVIGTVAWSEFGGSGRLVADAGAITSLRTGAAVGVATDLLAPRDATVFTLIGAGGQGPDQVRGVNAVRLLSKVTIVDRHHDRARAVAEALRHEMPAAEFIASTDVRAAVSDADIICCATTSRTPLFELSDLKARVHVNAIGAFRLNMRELPDQLLSDSTVVVDDVEAVLQEAGDIVHAISARALAKDRLLPLGVALCTEFVRADRTVFKSVGVAMQDWAIANLLATAIAGQAGDQGSASFSRETIGL